MEPVAPVDGLIYTGVDSLLRFRQAKTVDGELLVAAVVTYTLTDGDTGLEVDSGSMPYDAAHQEYRAVLDRAKTALLEVGKVYIAHVQFADAGREDDRTLRLVATVRRRT